ncbi:MFS transporter [Kribbella sp. NPDC051770]|uniref:MFS transporter n=1 Tax=Kribbella sp. NPDC051770 TaxID=3155413 RepID=UPI0034295786
MPRSRWTPIVAYSLVGAATQLVWLNFAGITTVAAARYDVSENAIGWLAQVFPLLYVVLAIPAGLLLDRWFRPSLLIGALLTALGALLRLGDTYPWLLTGQLVASVAQPLVLNAVTGITGRYLSPRDRPTGIAAGTASIFAGMVIAFVLSAFLASSNQIPVVLVISAIFSVIAAIALLLALRLPALHTSASPRPDRNALRTAWSDPLIRRLCLLAMFPFGVFVALTTFAQALLEPSGVSASTASTILLVNVIAGVLGSATIPILVSRHQAASAQLTLSLTATAIACVCLALFPGPLVGYLAITTIGVLLLPALPVVLEIVERQTGEAEGTAAGLIWMSGNLGGLLVATAVGLMVNHPTPAFLVMAAIALIATPGARALRHSL